MTEERVSHLYKTAMAISSDFPTPTETVLKSYYLMRCHEITKSFGLPAKQFSSNLRCSYCCSEWKNGNYETKISTIKLNKKQKRKTKSLRDTSMIQEKKKSQQDMLNSNQLQRTCLFCKHSTIIPLEKPNKTKAVCIGKNIIQTAKYNKQKTDVIKSNVRCKSKKVLKQETKKIKTKEINVYCNTGDVFSLHNKNNIIAGPIKGPTKIIKNNKKKKDKFAGLSKAAVLASAKLAKIKESKNALNLFLKPSS